MSPRGLGLVVLSAALTMAANLLIREHGADAEIVAARRADEMLERGEHDGKMVWLRIRRAIVAFQAVECWGMARVDFFLDPDGALWVNEINTIPGFTSISMYPKLWEASGLTYAELIERLLDLALERHGAERAKTSRARELEG